MIFRNRFKCCLLSVEMYSSFEAQLIKLEMSNPVQRALVNAPTKSNKLFI